MCAAERAFMLLRADRLQGLAFLKRATGVASMKKQEIQIGSLYLAKVGARSVEVRIEGSLTKGGWNAKSVASGKPVRIKDAAKLKPVKAAPEEPTEAAPEPEQHAPEASDATPEVVPLTKLDREKHKPRSKAAKPVKEKAMSCLDAAA